jgi:hypothetical protein
LILEDDIMVGSALREVLNLGSYLQGRNSVVPLRGSALLTHRFTEVMHSPLLGGNPLG